MFVVTLTYTAPSARIDELLPDHVEWLKKYYAAGIFLASGRRVPRTGGVILAHATDQTGLRRILAEDPFGLAGVATYEITEFIPTRTAPGLVMLAEDPA